MLTIKKNRCCTRKVVNSLTEIAFTHCFVVLSILTTSLMVPSYCLGAKKLGYLYIESSEGNSSGGHTAVQFGEDIYHYQYLDPGIIRLQKQNANDFEFAYRFLNNRTIHIRTNQEVI